MRSYPLGIRHLEYQPVAKKALISDLYAGSPKIFDNLVLTYNFTEQMIYQRTTLVARFEMWMRGKMMWCVPCYLVLCTFITLVIQARCNDIMRSSFSTFIMHIRGINKREGICFFIVFYLFLFCFIRKEQFDTLLVISFYICNIETRTKPRYVWMIFSIDDDKTHRELDTIEKNCQSFMYL